LVDGKLPVDPSARREHAGNAAANGRPGARARAGSGRAARLPRRRQLRRPLPAIGRGDARVVAGGRRGNAGAADLPMSTLIWGAGAIGGTLGAYLARAGVDVTLVDTVAAHVEAIARDGLRVTGPIDEFTVRVPAYVPGALAGTWDEIILATKAHH